MNPLGNWHGRLPSDWPLVPLRYVAKLGTGHTPDRTKPEYWVDCNIPWVTAADLSIRPTEFEPLMETGQHISALGVANSAAVVHPPGTVMLCRTASVGLLTVTGRPMATTQAFVTWSPGPRLLSRYLLYVLAAMRPELFRIAYGSTHLTIYMPDLESLRVPLPPLDEQQRIVDFIDDQAGRLDHIIAARRKQIALLQERQLASLERRVLDLATESEVVRLGRVVHRIEQGWSPQCEERVPGEDEWGVLKVSAVKSGTFHPEASKALPVDIAPQTAYEVRPGDLLVSRANSPKLVGEMAVVPPGSRERLLLCDKLYRLRLADEVDERFVALVGRTRQIRDHFALSATGTSQSMVNIRGDDLRSVALPLPPRSEQRLFVEEAETHAMENDLAPQRPHETG